MPKDQWSKHGWRDRISALEVTARCVAAQLDVLQAAMRDVHGRTRAMFDLVNGWEEGLTDQQQLSIILGECARQRNISARQDELDLEPKEQKPRPTFPRK